MTTNNDAVFLTPEGYAAKEQELIEARRMLHEEIPERIRVAKSHELQLQENQEFLELHRQRDYYEREVARLEELLNRATVLEAHQISSETATIGTRVTIKETQTGEQLELELVDPAEADLEAGKISISAPLGEMLVGEKVGTEVELDLPKGTVQYRILGIELA